MKTSEGDIHIALFEDKAPLTCKNFIRYIEEGFYNGTIFHRVIPNFMIQGGGFEPQMQQKTTHAEIKNEANNGLKNAKGTLAMARRPDPDSATSQFFINTTDNFFLDFTDTTSQGWGYCVFANVTKGFDIVQKIEIIPTMSVANHQDVPQKDIVIESVSLDA